MSIERPFSCKAIIRKNVSPNPSLGPRYNRSREVNVEIDVSCDDCPIDRFKVSKIHVSSGDVSFAESEASSLLLYKCQSSSRREKKLTQV